MNAQEPFDMQSSPSFVEFFQRLLTADFMPHGHCYFWRPEILWLNVGSDVLIAFSYFSIPLILFYFVRKIKNLPLQPILILFGSFIFLCGMTHIIQAWTTWVPAYRLEGLVKLLTGIVSLTTVFYLIPFIPKAVSLTRMEALVHELSQKAKDLKRVNMDLERFNRISMGRENRILELKQEVNRLYGRLGEEPPYKTPE